MSDAFSPYAPPKTDERLTDPTERALYSPAAITACTIFFTPVMGGIMMRRNWARLGDAWKATYWLLIGIGSTLALLLLTSMAPRSLDGALRPVSLGVTVALASAMRRELRPKYDAHIAAGGKKASALVPALIGIALLALVLGAMIWADEASHG